MDSFFKKASIRLWAEHHISLRKVSEY